MSQFRPSRALSRAAWMCLGAMMGVLTLSGLVQAEAVHAAALSDASAATGRRMFYGDASLQGAIVGHPEALPPRLTACANCHEGAASLAAASFGPRLDGTHLTEMRGRRGGPPSAFSSTSFCRMLRTGVDPASILITRQMPRYTLDDNQCLGLWHYLTETSHVGSN